MNRIQHRHRRRNRMRVRTDAVVRQIFAELQAEEDGCTLAEVLQRWQDRRASAMARAISTHRPIRFVLNRAR